MSSTVEQQAERVVTTFFDPTVNAVTALHLDQNEFLAKCVERLRRGKPTVLPHRHPQTQVLRWMCVARTEGALRELREGVDAFVGRTWAVIHPARLELGDHTAARAALMDYSGGRVFQIEGRSEKSIHVALGRMFAVWAAAPSRTRRENTSPAALLRGFESALQVGDREAAANALRLISEDGSWSARNLRFLEVQYFDALGDCEGLLSMRDLPDIVAGRRPAAVTDALLRAAYHKHLAQFDVRGAAERALEEYQNFVAPSLSALIDEGAYLRTAGARIVACASAVDREDWDRLRDTSELLREQGTDSPVVAEWLSKAPEIPESVPSPSNTLEDARRLYFIDRRAAYLAAARSVDVDPVEKSALLLRLADDLRDGETVAGALAFIQSLRGEERERLDRLVWVPEVLADLGQGAIDERVPTSWLDWLGRVCDDEAYTGEVALRAAREARYEWIGDSLLGGGTCASLADKIEALPDRQRPTLSSALPLLVGALELDADYPNPTFAEVYVAILEHIAYDELPTESDLRVYIDLLPAALESRLDAAKYRDVMDGLIEAFRARESSVSPDLLLDALDAAALAACADAEARLRLLTFATDVARRQQNRWDTHQVSLLRDLITELASEDLINWEFSSAVSDPKDAGLRCLDKAYVAIYTLTESAGVRAEAKLREMVPGIARIESSAARVGTESLAAMARSADVFVMVTRSAQHAATDFVQANRQDRPVVKPLGKGSSSIIRALRAFCSN